MADPKCPECGISGLEHIVSEESKQHSKGGDPWFEVAYCKECGHVYGVFAKVIHGPSIPIPKYPPIKF